MVVSDFRYIFAADVILLLLFGDYNAQVGDDCDMKNRSCLC